MATPIRRTDTSTEETSSFSESKTEPTESDSTGSDTVKESEKIITESPCLEAETSSMQEKASENQPISTKRTPAVTTPEKEEEQPTASTPETKPCEPPVTEETQPSTPTTSEPTTEHPSENDSVEQPTPKPKTIYDYEFDVEAIRSEMIAVGQAMGLTHIIEVDGIPRTPDNSSWATPVTASKDFQGTNLERRLKDYVQSMPGLVTAFGGNTIQYFTIYAEPLGGGSYRFYFLY